MRFLFESSHIYMDATRVHTILTVKVREKLLRVRANIYICKFAFKILIYRVLLRAIATIVTFILPRVLRCY